MSFTKNIIALFNKDEETKEKLKRKLTANEFMNIKNIKNDILYTIDNNLFVYIKIQPISLELLSKRKQKICGRQFSAEFSSIKIMYKLFSISRPVDASFMIENFKQVQADTIDKKRKEVLRNKITELNSFAMSGDILEHNFFMILWLKDKDDAEREILKQANEVMARFSACKMNVSLCKKGDIIKLLNLFANPNYAHLEDYDMNEYIPFVE